MEAKPIRLLSLFSGIGAFEEALKNLKVDVDLVNYCEFQPEIARAYSIIHNTPIEKNLGDITKVDEKQLEDFDLMTYGFPCFTGDTLVLTDKGYRKIVDVEVGDKVLSHTNSFKTVSAKFNQGVKPISIIKGMCMHELKTTSNHKFYVRKKRKAYKKEREQGFSRVFSEPEWLECERLNKNYYMGAAINTNSKLPVWGGLETNFTDGRKRYKNDLSEKFNNPLFWWLVGRYIGDGWLVNRNDRKGELSKVVICCGKHELGPLTEKINGLFHFTVAEDKTTYKLHFTNKELAIYLEQFGRGAAHKRLTTDILDLPVDLLESFIEGYISADGCTKKKVIRMSSVSKELIYGMGQCIAKVYKRPYSIYETKVEEKRMIEGREVNQKNNYVLHFKREKGKHDHAFYEDGYVWFPIQSITHTDIIEEVFDITVEDDHSFTANGVIAHNCQDISALGSQKGFFNEDGELTRSGLFFEAMRIAKEKQPKYMIAENVRALVSKPMKDSFDGMLKLLDELGYNSYWQILNSKDYGVPHSRNRIFIVSIRKDVDDNSFIFPEAKPLKIKAKDLYDIGAVSEEFYLSANQDIYYNEMRLKKKYSSLNSDVLICMTTKQGGKSNPQNFIKDSKGVRILTDSELMVFQGFRREYGPLLRQNGFETKRIGYMAGNSITVNVVENIFKSLIPEYIVNKNKQD